jgi:phospholipase C
VILRAAIRAALALAALSGAATAAQASELRAATSPIKHVVFIVQENRSFNNLFMGFPGALTQRYGYNEKGKKVMLHPQTLLTQWDIDHSSDAFFSAYDNGKIDGWNRENACCRQPKNFAYAYTPRSEIEPYWDMARQYVLADNMFQSNLDGSFVAHQYTIAAFADHTVDYPSSYWGCPGGAQDKVPTLRANRTIGRPIEACFDYPTIGSEADTAGLSWRSYTGSVSGDGGLWNAYQASRPVYDGPDWNVDVIDPQYLIINDVAGTGTNVGHLAAVTWVTPTYSASDHAGMEAGGGPAWVASVVDAIGESQFWDSTAIFIMWDDWGGWYDPVKPVYEDYDGLGFRVPLIVISPYAKKGYVSHVQYETSSVLRFMEDNFHLPHLAASDKRANDPAADVFDFTQQPRPFVPIDGGEPSAFWAMRARLDRAPQWHGSPAGGD